MVFVPNADATVNFASKRPKYADTGGRGWSNFAGVLYGCPLKVIL